MLDKTIRKFVPSVAKLTRSPLFYPFSVVGDLTLGRFFRSVSNRYLPPLRYLARTGVRNDIFAPHFYYLTAGTDFWIYVFANQIASLDSKIVDIGCGCGKTAVTFRDFDYHRTTFTGHYFGFDVDRDMVQWCCDNFTEDHFSFTHLDVHSSVYNPDGDLQSVRLEPCASGSIDLVISNSLFSHLLEPDIRNYIEESARVLKPGGVMMMTFFCIEDLRELGRVGDRWTFLHRNGAAYVENPKYPEAAVAYEKEWMLSVCQEAGFETSEVRLPMYQSTLFCRR